MTTSLMEIIINYACTHITPPKPVEPPHYDYTHKLLIIGDEQIGKTCIFNRYIHDKFTANYKATIGVDFNVKRQNVGYNSHTLRVWDTAGQQRFRQITSAYYRGPDGIFIVFDVTNKKSFESIKTEFMSS